MVLTRSLDSRRRRLLQALELSSHILHFCPQLNGLRPWFWPVCNHERVAPSELNHYRETHEFSPPNCLCSLDPREGPVECMIYEIPEGRRRSGEWMAACAHGRCGYRVDLNAKFDRVGLLVRRCPERPVRLSLSPDPSIRRLTVARIRGRNAGRSASPVARETIINAVLSRLDALPPPQAPRPTKVIDIIWTLDAWDRPGLSHEELARLLSVCDVCGLIMTKRAFERHHCFDIREREGSEEPMDLDTVMGDDSHELY